MTKKRPHLRAKTTGVLNALATFGPGGATCAQIAERADVRTRSTRSRLVWLKRGGLVRYVARAGGLW